MLVSHLYSNFGKMSIQALCQFLTWAFVVVEQRVRVLKERIKPFKK